MKRILFVDDEQRILDGLQRLLRPQRHHWEMSFAPGGEAALALMACTPLDVIISDMRMPGMDGAALLERVRQQYPHVVRIVLTGHTEIEAALRAVRVAHQFLLKPCDADMLRVAIERACSLQGILTSPTIAATVGAVGELPSAPRVYTALTQALADPNSSVERVAEIVERDVAISAKVLQLVNSAFFGLARNISSIQQAVIYLGFNILQGLVASVETFRAFGKEEQIEGFSIDEFQDHAQLTARIAGKFSLPKHLADSAVVGSLLHDVGKLVFASRIPERFRQALQTARDRQQPLYQVEQELYGVTHAEVGAYLLGLWGLPTLVAEVVAHHHVPARVPHQQLDALTVVYLANLFAHEIAPSSDGLPFDPVDEAFLQSLGVAGQYPAWQQMAHEMTVDLTKVSQCR